MKRIVLVVLAVAGAVVVGLTACSNSGAPAAAPGSAPVPVSCSQKYQGWEQGPGKGVIATLNAVSVAGTAGDPHMLTVALNKARPTLARVVHNPVPACADPRGYWDVLLMHVNAAMASKGSASSVRAALKDVPKIENELTTELQAAAQ